MPCLWRLSQGFVASPPVGRMEGCLGTTALCAVPGQGNVASLCAGSECWDCEQAQHSAPEQPGCCCGGPVGVRTVRGPSLCSQ